MDLHFNIDIASNYSSNAQKIRVISENWVAQNVFCPNCGHIHIDHLANNKPVADFQCSNCGEIYELKSKFGNIGKKIADGAYSSAIKRINSATNPGLLILQYNRDYYVNNLLIVPKFFFLTEMIEKRTPLSDTARRAGWVGCNILFSKIPCQGKINIISNGIERNKSDVIEHYSRARELQTNNLNKREWLMDILYCVNSINSTEFILEDMYKFRNYLQERHINNHHIEDKIRQQLQILRDKGIIEFLGHGRYRKLL